ncbi:MAG TPA: hypothetical protein VKI19_12470 [Acidimicrobiales bacterium]|nr:hypothetical protein [Acidimicrobiales bacterium]
MLARKSFFSFVELPDPSRHHEYNEYHQLDHRPSNLALPGVVWGDRWVRTPECAAASTGADDRLMATHYVAMYWFADPVERSVQEWQELGERAFQWGRKPDTEWSRRKVGSFVPLKGYVTERVRVSEDVLPFRPVRGMHITVSEMAEPHRGATEEVYRWYDRVRIPELLGCRGVAGAWTFYSEWSTFGAKDDRDIVGRHRITLLYLDGRPDDFLADRSGLPSAPDRAAVETVLLDSPLLAIEPWKWDWFDGGSGTGG